MAPDLSVHPRLRLDVLDVVGHCVDMHRAIVDLPRTGRVSGADITQRISGLRAAAERVGQCRLLAQAALTLARRDHLIIEACDRCHSRSPVEAGHVVTVANDTRRRLTFGA